MSHKNEYSLPQELFKRISLIDGKLYNGSELVGELQPEMNLSIIEIVDETFIRIAAMIKVAPGYYERS